MLDFMRGHRKQPPPIRVILIPSSTYYLCNSGCSIYKLASQLNTVQRHYRFVVPVKEPEADFPRTLVDSLSLVRRKPLSTTTLRPGAIKSSTERTNAVATYVGVEDAAEQALKYARDAVAGWENEAPLDQGDIIAVIGGDVVVLDVPDNEFEGDVSLDSYSCVAVNGDNYHGIKEETPEGVDILDYNDNLIPIQQVGFISLRRIPVIFPEIIVTDIAQRARNIVSRYVISNLCALVGNSSFGVSLSHDRISGCVNETNWIGGERESYYFDFFCKDCVTGYRRSGVRSRYRPRAAQDFLDSLHAQLRLRDKLDAHVRDSEKIALWVNIGLVAVSLNIIDAFVFEFILEEHNEDIYFKIANWTLVLKPHIPALIVAGLVFLLGTYYLSRHVIRLKRLP